MQPDSPQPPSPAAAPSSPAAGAPPKVRICGVDIDAIDLETLLARVSAYADANAPALVNYVNVHGMNLAHDDAAFRDVLNRSDILFCDGFGVKLGARILGHRIGERMTPPDWIDRLFEQCAAAGHAVYFVGDTAEVIEVFVKTVRERHPQLSIAGHDDGFFELRGEQADRIVADLRAKRPPIVITGMGMPRQEIWARDVRDELQHGVFLATGALFRWYSGYEKRAPRWMTDHGLEWLARVVTSPRKLWRRYLVGNPRFLFRVFRERFKRQ